jgi:hypothetical protein
LFESGNPEQIYQTLDQCIESIVYYSKPWQITSKNDLMVENNPILSTKQFIEFSFYSCSDEYEQLIGSDVVCATTDETLEHIRTTNGIIGMWWIELIHSTLSMMNQLIFCTQSAIKPKQQ